MSIRISRSLAYERTDGERRVIGQDEIESFYGTVVILGDPGLGKSVLCRALGEHAGMSYIGAGRFVNAEDPESLVAEGERVIIDGLDEIASSVPGGVVDSVLRQLVKMGDPPFILSCREADWRGAADSVKIEDEYAGSLVVMHLEPFNYEDAREFLSHEFPDVDEGHILEHLAERGIEDLCRNPLTLRMLGEVAQEELVLPDSRAELFDRACCVMLKEDNPRHSRDSHARRGDEELMLASGAVCATLVLCSRTGIYDGAYAETPAGFVNVSDINGLPYGEAVADAIRVRLFQADGENRFTHTHRVIAEYLGAKWLAQRIEDGISERRIFALFRHGDGVPTSLRGLHAWMAHFGDALAIRCIEADPYAVLRYGDADRLGLEQACALLAALARLSEEDPYFRSEDWGRHPASGLMRPELKYDILDIIGTPGRHLQLTVLLVEAMAGTELAAEIVPTLEAMMFDLNRDYDERAAAADAIRSTGGSRNWEAVVKRLLAMGDGDSARLACELLEEVGASAVSVQTAIDTVVAHLGLDVDQDREAWADEIRVLGRGLFGDLDTERLVLLLDALAERARPLVRDVDGSARGELTDLVRRIVLAVLKAEPAIDPQRLWKWIDWLGGSDGYSREARKRLERFFGEKSDVRRALIEYVLLTPCADNTWMAAYHLGDTGLGLHPTDEDIEGVLKTLRAHAGTDGIDPEVWRDVLRLGLSESGMKAVVRDAAVEVADGNDELLSILAELSEVVEPTWKKRAAKRDAKRQAEIAASYQPHRDTLSKRAKQAAAGNIPDLLVPAGVYLNRNYGFDRSASPEERVRVFLGDTLAEQVLEGFMAVLGRSDLPNASEIAEFNFKKPMRWGIGADGPMICGIAEMLRRGLPIDRIDRRTLRAVYMAWRLAPETGLEEHIVIDSALEGLLFTSEEEIESHFRACIEPQLECNRSHIRELRRLGDASTFAELAGRLAVEWLRDYSALNGTAQTELMECAVWHAHRDTLRELVADCLARSHPDKETSLLWWSVTYWVGLERYREELYAVAADDRDFLWFVNERTGPESGEYLRRLSLAQLVFIVEAFGTHWPIAELPRGPMVGSHHPWDASRFINRAINEIANRTSSEATEALQKLIGNHAPSYVDTMKHALMLQRKARRDSEYAAPTVGELRAVVEESLPESIDDMRACFADCIEAVQERLRGSDTDMWEVYWASGEPRNEDFCRNRLMDQMSSVVPAPIRLVREASMPARTRADVAVIYGSIGLPVEIKGQWHCSVWDAACEQLDEKYTRDWHAEGRGAYIVFWFGDVPGKQLPGNPDGLAPPKTPEDLREMLADRIPEARRSYIDVFVMDVSAPGRAG